MIEYLQPVRPVTAHAGAAGPEHPMRRVTIETARDPASWTPGRRAEVAARFGQLAADWHRNHDDPRRYESIDDALDRGGPFGPVVVELGAGTGLGTQRLARRFGRIVALDLSLEMIRQVGASEADRVVADGARLPLRDRSVDVLVLVNMLLFAGEVDRVLGPRGALVWVNTNADRTPIHLAAEEVESALPGRWTGVESRAGSGSWAVLRRVVEVSV